MFLLNYVITFFQSKFGTFNLKFLRLTSFSKMSCGGGCCCGGAKSIEQNNEFAIDSFKRAFQEKGLEFVKIESATQQIVAGSIFDGICEAKEGGKVGRYKIKVWVKVANQGIEVQAFEKL